MRYTSISKCSLLLPAIALLACGSAIAQSPTYKVGRPPTAEDLREWDNVVGTDGKELPPGSGTAVEGAKIYAAKCASCHGKTGVEGPYPRLIGGVGTVNSPNPVLTAGSFWPYATTIWDYISRSMPRDAEGSLKPNEVYALTAFILNRNGIIKESDVVDNKTILEIQMPNRDGFYPAVPESSTKNSNWKPHWPEAKPPAKSNASTSAPAAQ
jgi:S-disulfanyl-L-cysteine oxidoreductase SoxD